MGVEDYFHELACVGHRAAGVWGQSLLEYFAMFLQKMNLTCLRTHFCIKLNVYIFVHRNFIKYLVQVICHVFLENKLKVIKTLQGWKMLYFLLPQLAPLIKDIFRLINFILSSIIGFESQKIGDFFILQFKFLCKILTCAYIA